MIKFQVNEPGEYIIGVPEGRVLVNGEIRGEGERVEVELTLDETDSVQIVADDFSIKKADVSIGAPGLEL